MERSSILFLLSSALLTGTANATFGLLHKPALPVVGEIVGAVAAVPAAIVGGLAAPLGGSDTKKPGLLGIPINLGSSHGSDSGGDSHGGSDPHSSIISAVRPTSTGGLPNALCTSCCGLFATCSYVGVNLSTSNCNCGGTPITTTRSPTTTVPATTTTVIAGPCAGGAAPASTYVASNGDVYGVCLNTSFNGTNIVAASGIQSASGCAELCSTRSNCIAGNYFRAAGVCTLKSSRTGAAVNADYDAVYKIAPGTSTTTTTRTSTTTAAATTTAITTTTAAVTITVATTTTSASGTGVCANGAGPASTYVATNGDVYGVCLNTDFTDSDITYVSGVSTTSGCAEACSRATGCVAAALVRAQSVCYLKSARQQPYVNAGVDSVYKISSGPGTSTTTPAVTTTSAVATGVCAGGAGPASTYVATNGDVYGVCLNTDFNDSDITYVSGVTTTSGCAEACSRATGCVAAALVRAQSVCYLKSARQQAIVNSGVDSVYKISSGPGTSTTSGTTTTTTSAVTTSAVATTTVATTTTSAAGTGVCAGGAGPASTYVATNGDVYGVCLNTDFTDSDITYVSGVASTSACAEACSRATGCVAAALVRAQSVCYLKSARQAPVANSGVDSVYKISSGSGTTTTSAATTTAVATTTTSAVGTGVCAGGAAPASTYVASNGDVYGVCLNTDFTDSDITYVTGVASTSACAEACSRATGCVAAALVRAQSVCYLKSARQSPVVNSGVDSVYKISSGTSTTTTSAATTPGAPGTTTSAVTTSGAPGTTTTSGATTTTSAGAGPCANGAAPASTYVATNGDVYGVCLNTDFQGGDITSVTGIASTAQCAEACSRQAGCVAGDLIRATQACYLKSTRNAATANTNVDSVYKISSGSGSSTTGITSTTQGPSTTSAATTTTSGAPGAGICAGGAAPASTYVAANGDVYGICLNTDFRDSDITFAGSVTSVNACADLCSRTTGCVAGAFVRSQTVCYLKSATNGVYANTGVDTAVKISSGSGGSTTTSGAPGTTTSVGPLPAVCAGGAAPASTYVASNGDVYGVCLNTDFNDSDITYYTGITSNPACAEACSRTAGCVAAALVKSSSVCYVKSARQGAYSNNNVDSVVKLASGSGISTTTGTTTTGVTTTGITTTTPLTSTTGTATSTTSAVGTGVCAGGAAPASTYVASNGDVYGVCLNTDFTDSDITSVSGSSTSACAEACSRQAGCAAAAFVRAQSFCYLKSARQTAVTNTGVDSVYKISSGSGSTTTTGATTSPGTSTSSAITTTTSGAGTGVCAGGAAPASTYVASNGDVYGVCLNTDFVDSDITYVSGLASTSACAEACSRQAGCVAGALVRAQSVCYLKSARQTAVTNAGVDSVYKISSGSSSTTTGVTTTPATSTTTGATSTTSAAGSGVCAGGAAPASTYVASNGDVYGVCLNTDFVDSDITYVTGIASTSACAESCSRQAGCVAGALVRAQSVCYLKSTRQTAVVNSGVDSVYKISSGPGSSTTGATTNPATTITGATSTTSGPAAGPCAGGAAPASTIVASNGDVYGVCLNTDFYDSDLTFINEITTTAACAEACSGVQGCVVGALNKPQSVCYIKTTRQQAIANPDVDSVYKISSGPGGSTTTTTSGVVTTTTAGPATTTTGPATTTTSAGAGPCANGAQPTATYAASNGAVYGICANTDFVDSDFESYIDIPSAAICAEACSRAAGCVAANFVRAQGYCYLKTARNAPVVNSAYDGIYQISPAPGVTTTSTAGPATTTSAATTTTGTAGAGPCANGAAPASTYVATNGDVYGVCLNTDFRGQDLNGVQGVTSTSACAEACSRTTGCVAGSLVRAQNVCYLKSSRTGAVVDSGVDGVYKISSGNGTTMTTSTRPATTTTNQVTTLTTTSRSTSYSHSSWSTSYSHSSWSTSYTHSSWVTSTRTAWPTATDGSHFDDGDLFDDN